MSKPDYDTSLARMAGNIAAGISDLGMMTTHEDRQRVAIVSVGLARAIVAEIKAQSAAPDSEATS